MSVILVVDDEPDVLLLVKTQLESEGFQVYTAESGREALEFLDKNKVDLLILDVVIPGMSGLDVLRKIRSGEKSGLPVVVFTALGREVDMMLKPENEADAYLRKPYTKEELVETVRGLLE
ncbi:response regulator [Candidatus Bathyarchaeota archaeon]|nr:response regulator [Candidatus Bathyarchaeota archaeon]